MGLCQQRVFRVGRLDLGGLARPHFGVQPAPGQQFAMGAPFRHLAAVQDDDLVGMDDGRQPVRDDQRGAPALDRL